MNTHIKEACKQYITQEVNPEYAIMINGPWGCGKTYFIDELLKESWLRNEDDNIEKNVVKISLYGVTSKEDIEVQLFYSTHKVLNNEILKGAGKLVDTFLVGKYNVDGKTAMSMCFKGWSKNVKVIIVDDVERSSMPMHDVMGYFYNYIIEQNIRIIFIGNEDEIKSENGSKDEKYIRTKEKVIGETYTIIPQVEDALKHFLSKKRKLDIQNLDEDKVAKKCIDIINKLGIYNLRITWQALVKVQKLLKEIVKSDSFNKVSYNEDEYNEGDHSKSDYLLEVIEIFMVLYLQYAKGYFSKDDKSVYSDMITEEEKDSYFKSIISDIIGAYKNRGCSIKVITEIDSLEKGNGELLNKIKGFDRIYHSFVPLRILGEDGNEFWTDFLYYSKIDRSLLEKAIEEDSNWFTPSKKINSNLYKLVSQNLDMEQEEFDRVYNNTIEEFKSGYYKKLSELIQGYSMCLIYKEYGIREYKKDEIKELFDLILKNTDFHVEMRTDYFYELRHSCMGHSDSIQMQSDEGKKFIEKLKSKIDEKRLNILRSDFIKLFDRVNNIDTLSKWANLLYNELYLDKDILDWIDLDDIFQKLILLPYSEQIYFAEALDKRLMIICSSERYNEHHQINNKYLKEITEKYKKYYDEIEIGSIFRYRYKFILDKYYAISIY